MQVSADKQPLFLKRSSNVDQSECSKEKKQKIFSSDHSQKPFTEHINRLDYLSNEVFYEIFAYLDGWDMLKAFSNLNHRFETLINHSSIPLKLMYYGRKSSLTNDYFKQIMLSNKHRLLSLQMSDWYGPDCFDYISFDNSFERLESLTLKKLSTDQLLMRCSQLKLLPRLYSLKIFVERAKDEGNVPNNPSYSGSIYCVILSLPVLKRCTIFMMDTIAYERFLIIPSTMKEQPSPIEYLHIKHPMLTSNVLFLLEYLPKIRSLNFEYSIQSYEIVEKNTKINVPFLKEIIIENCYMSFDALETFIEKIGKQLTMLKLFRNEDPRYIDTERWERMIKTYLPQLKTLDIEWKSFSSDNFNLTHSVRNVFHLACLIERRWFTTVSFDRNLIKIHVHPYKKQWFDWHREMEIDSMNTRAVSHRKHLGSASENVPRFINIESNDRSLNGIHAELLEKIKHLCSEVPFTHLSLSFWPTLSILMDIKDVLLHLDCLVLECIDDIDLESLSEGRMLDQLSFSQKNRITKLKIDPITQTDKVRCCMDLCPRMEYLELVIESDRLDVVTVLELILKDRPMKVPNLRSICFDAVNVDCNVLAQLCQVIDDNDSLIRNYNFQRVKNRIYFQWD